MKQKIVLLISLINLVLLIVNVYAINDKFSWFAGRPYENLKKGEISAYNESYLYYYSGNIKENLPLLKDEISIQFKTPIKTNYLDNVKKDIMKVNSDIEILSLNEANVLIKISEGVDVETIARELQETIKDSIISPVFFPRKALTGEIIIHFKEEMDDTSLSNFESKYNLEKIKFFEFSENTYLFKAPSAVESLTIANQIYETGEVKYSYPNWLRKGELKETMNEEELIGETKENLNYLYYVLPVIVILLVIILFFILKKKK